MDDIYTMTPGSAVADKLQQILTQKRLQSHQDMMDRLAAQNADLNRQNVQSEIQARQAADDRGRQMLGLEQKRWDALDADRNAQEVQRRLANFSMGQPLVGSDLQFVRQSAPSMEVPGQDAVSLPNQEDIGPERPAIPPTFYGHEKERAEARKNADEMSAIQKMMSPEFEGMSPIQKEAFFQTNFHRGAPASIVAPKGDEWSQFMTPEQIQANGGWAPNNTHVLPVEKTPPQQHYTDLGPELGEDDQPTGNHVLLDTNTGQKSIIPMRVGKKGGAPAPKGPSDRIKLAYSTTKRDWLKNPNDPLKDSMLKQQAAMLVDAYPADPDVKEKVLSVFNQPHTRNFSVDDFKNKVIAEGSDPVKSKQALALWQLLVQ